MSQHFFNEYFKVISDAVSSISEEKLIAVSDLARATANNSKKIIIVGNGGSAAMASHVAVDFTKVAGVRSINFNEADLITCFANDYGYENWISEALKAYADKGDLLILISSSGRSPNIINGALQAKKMGLNIVSLSGFGGDNPLRKFGDIELWLDSTEYNVVEMAHHIWLVAIVDYMVAKKGF
ncbi:GmhA Phosphoheptose isomerase [Methylophilaceae bacterium]